MGKARSYEIIEYRKKIMEQICNSKELVKLLGESDAEHPEDAIPFKRCFPHEFIPDTITKTDKYINFDISATLDPRNNVYKDLTIYFFISCHEEVVQYRENGRTYLWYDKVVCELDQLFSETFKLGVNELALSSNLPYCPQQKFKGRVLKFKVNDFYNGLKYGK